MVMTHSKTTAPIMSIILGLVSLPLAVNPLLGGLPRLLPFPAYSIIGLALGITGLVLGLKSRKTTHKNLALAGSVLCGLTLLMSMAVAVFLAYIVFVLQGI